MDEAPGHHSLPFEMEDCITVMHLAMCFGWGFSASAHGSTRVVNHDHDGVFWLSSPEPEDAGSINDFYARCGIAPESRAGNA